MRRVCACVGNAMTEDLPASKQRRPRVIRSLPALRAHDRAMARAARAQSRWCRPWARCTPGISPWCAWRNAAPIASIVSIFVNPTQFAPHEDLTTYPRTFDADVAALAASAVDLVWAPSARNHVSAGLCHAGRAGRPGQGRTGRRLPAAFLRRRGDRRRQASRSSASPTSRCSARRITSSSRWSRRWRATSICRPALSRVPTVRERDGLALSSRNALPVRGRTRGRADAASRARAIARTRSRAGQPIAGALDRRPRGDLDARASRSTISRRATPRRWHPSARPRTGRSACWSPRGSARRG